MSAEMLFAAELRFADQLAVDAAWRELEREGCLGDEDNLVADSVVRSGLVVSFRWDGSGPASCFEVTAGVVAILARHAVEGEAVALELESRWGYRYPAGYDPHDADFDDEVEENEVDELCEKYRADDSRGS